ncbi:MAG: 16S rRNA (adenine(1518)-N(6)/adenine(1519)-N(6))-dimethyltransferase RsmA [Bryobacteraceae bacterium]
MARQHLGQHFLIKGSILERIAKAACPDAAPLVVEIGPGKGALTAHLLPRAARLIAIELDDALGAHLQEKYRGDSRVEIVAGDATRIDLAQWGPAVIAGNLPYYAATAIMERVWRMPQVSRAVFLVQKEVAERLAAAPGCRDYGALSVEAQLFARVELLFGVRPSAFQPPPKVESSVVRLTPHPPEVGDPEAFLQFVRLAFHQKRKTLRNNLAVRFPRTVIDALPEAGLRAEQLPLLQFAQLYRRLVP